MKNLNILNLMVETPKLVVTQAVKPIRVAMRKPKPHPTTQRLMAKLVEESFVHEVRAGFTHRFITILFVTVGSRVFCRRYTYSEPSWHSAFLLGSPQGQIKLDKTIVNIEARAPEDMGDILHDVDKAYQKKLKQLGASFLLAGATEPRAHASTIELFLSET
ncbi:DUF2255 family protein [Vibrio sp. HN007]|uniref:DUF2255 family protein n=1 Tax=Vibrio iocasae TaxID=3098914 RepID=UPI0035D4D374